MANQVVDPGKISIVASNTVEKKHAKIKLSISELQASLAGKKVKNLTDAELRDLVAMICLKLDLIDDKDKL